MIEFPPQIALRDPHQARWLLFSKPIQILTTDQIDQVLPLVQQVDQLTQIDGYWAAGFLAYEAASAFDPCLITQGSNGFPLLWFGIFNSPQQITELPTQSTNSLPLTWRSSLSAQEYHHCLAQIHSYIHQGETYQVNFTYRYRSETTTDPWLIFLELMGDQGSPYGAYIHTGDWGICCASPELFFRLNGDRIESQPMKGTAARGLGFEDDQQQLKSLLNSEKERAENIMITDMVRNDLGRIARVGSVQVPSLLTAEQYPTVWQITSTVQAQTQASLDQILTALFPAASITGAPKRRSMEIIRQLERSPRRIYTGTIGYVAPRRQAQFNVAIRTLLINTGTGETEYGVGGGIVWESQPDLELQECQAKARILAPRQDHFDLIETLLWDPDQGFMLLDYHLKRLSQSAQYFSFSIDLDRVIQVLDQQTQKFLHKPHRVRLQINRSGHVDCEARPIDPSQLRFQDLPLARHPIDQQNLFLYHKTTHRQVYDQAIHQAQGPGDVLLFNQAGQITESTIANVAFWINETWVTPPVHCGLLPGTYRAWLLDQKKIHEGIVTREEAIHSSAVCLFNSVRGMHQVQILDVDRY